MEAEAIFFLIIAAILFFAGFTQGVCGFGSGLVAVPLLGLFLPLKTVVPFTILNGIVITAAMCWELRRGLRPGLILPLAAGCVPGVAVGAVFLSRAPAALLQGLLGLIVFAYAVYSLLDRKRRPRPPSTALGMAAGFGTGAIGAAFSAGGPPTIIYLSSLDRNPAEIKAAFAGFFLITGLMIAASHLAAGLVTARVLRLFAIGAPAVLAGSLLGTKLSGRMDGRRYRRLVLQMLLLMGAVLMFRGAAAW